MFRLAPLGLRLTLVVVVLLCVAFARADEGDTPAIRRVPAYCGIYSVYGALNALGVKCEFADFVSSKYVTSKFGSTIDDLKKAAEDHRAFALAESNLTASDLRDAPCPVVLHVADERRIGVYNHWVLYLGTEDGLVRVVDAPHELELMPFAELLARWDSIGLFVSDKPIELGAQTARHWLTTMLAVSLAALVWRHRVARQASAALRPRAARGCGNRRIVGAAGCRLPLARARRHASQRECRDARAAVAHAGLPARDIGRKDG